LPTTPYVLAAEFAAHPTYLDLNGLRTGAAVPADQTAELTNILLMASEWADGECNQTLGAHQVVQNGTARIDRDGNLQIPPTDTPVLSVSSLAYGASPTTLTPASPLAYWIGRGQVIYVPFAAGRPSTSFYTQTTYEAGFVSTALTADAALGATTLTVADPMGILPGASYRLWEPGAEETVTVSPSYAAPEPTVPPTPVAVPLAGPTRFPHESGGSWTGMPSNLRLAITNYAVSLLMRPDTTAEDQFPDTALASTTRSKDPRPTSSGLVSEARRILQNFRRVR